MLQKLNKVLPLGFMAFAVVGTAGFIVDAGILGTLVHGYGWGDYSARGISFVMAVTTTWALNRTFVFSDRRTSNVRSEYTRYVVVQSVGTAVNLMTFAMCINGSEFMDRWPVTAVAAGSLVALFFNYVGSRVYVFTDTTPQSIESKS